MADSALKAQADRFADAVVATLYGGVAKDLTAVPAAPVSCGGLMQAAFRHKSEERTEEPAAGDHDTGEQPRDFEGGEPWTTAATGRGRRGRKRRE
ncbi:MAG: hypothetical protein IV100_07655 [Myxococcales bacterium]|nr:hypothetical protein [Myxococcales bacterium]